MQTTHAKIVVVETISQHEPFTLEVMGEEYVNDAKFGGDFQQPIEKTIIDS
jgi:hypothetical protein